MNNKLKRALYESIMKNVSKSVKKFLNESGMFDDDIFNDDNSILLELDVNDHMYRYHPKTTKKLKELITERIEEEGTECDLNDIDVSLITNMGNLFFNSLFNGDISKWKVSNVKNMRNMFYKSLFNGDISLWNVSNVTNMNSMFMKSLFNGDISQWNVYNVKDMREMFSISEFNQDISNWNLNSKCNINYMFDDCPLENQPQKLCKL